MNILLLFGLPDEILNAAQHAHPQWHFISKSDYQPTQAGTIDVILGWNATAAEIIAQPNRVRLVQTMSAGVDYLPLAELREQGILVANTSGIHAEPIAEYVLAGVLAFARGLFPVVTNWQQPLSQFALAESQAVVFGTGHIGTAIAKHLHQFGVQVIGVDRHGEPKPEFDQVTTDAQIAAKADIIVNVMPLTPQTQHYFNREFFSQLKRQPLFINAGRGPSVDEAALIAALAHQLEGAVLDVFETEPLPETSPLWQMPNVWLTPHVAGDVAHLRQQVAEIFLPNVASLEATGHLRDHQVNLSTGY